MSNEVNARRDHWIRKFSSQLPGTFDFSEARKCWDAGHADATAEQIIKYNKLVDELFACFSFEGSQQEPQWIYTGEILKIAHKLRQLKGLNNGTQISR